LLQNSLDPAWLASQWNGCVFLCFDWLSNALLDDFDGLWSAIGINLFVGDSLDKLAVVLENRVHFCLQLD
jgi:hypothetical protein